MITKSFKYLAVNFLLIFSCALYAGYNYYIHFKDLSHTTITVDPIYHNCIYAFSSQPIIIKNDYTSSITIRANNSGSCAFEEAEEKFIFWSDISSAGWIAFYMGDGNNTPNTHSSGNVFALGNYGQDFVNRWTFYSDNDETTMVTFW